MKMLSGTGKAWTFIIGVTVLLNFQTITWVFIYINLIIFIIHLAPQPKAWSEFVIVWQIALNLVIPISYIII